MTPMARASVQARGGLVVLLGLSLLLWADPAWAAFGSVGSFCTASEKPGTASSSWTTLTTTAQLDAGNLGIIVLATDNLATTDGNTSTHTSITDAAGNTWTKAREFTNSRGAAAAGVTVSVWYSKAGANLASGASITVNFSGAIKAKAVTCWEYTVGAGNIIAVDGGADRADNGVDAGAITLSGLANIQHLWLRGTGVEDSNSNITYAASTNFTAFTHTSSGTTGAGAATNASARGEFRIFTATSQTTDPTTTATDNASTMVALSEVACAVSEAAYVTVNAQAGQATVYWSSASPVLILRNTAAFAGEAPAHGTSYAVGATIGAATVVYDGSVAETSFTDTGLTNGTTYYYKVFAKTGSGGASCYAPGTVNPSGGTYATPGTGTGAPQWSYATTAASLAPPGLAPNDVVIAGSNDNKLHGVNAPDGTRAFAPFPTGGPIQGRAPVIPLEYSATGLDIAYVTSQDGYVYAVNTNTGAQVWQSPLLGTMLQGGAAVWLQAVEALTIGGAATDAVFVGTRNTCGTTSNKVYALNGKNTTVNGVAPGGILWTFNPDPSPPYSVDCISSTPYVDYWNNAVWLTSRSNGGTTTPSLWKLDAATGAVLASWNLGDIDSSPTPSFDVAFMYVGTNAGTLKAIRISNGTVWTHTPASGTGAIKGLPWPLSYDVVGPAMPDTIIFSRNTTVHSVNFDGSTFTPNWTTTLTKLVQQNTGSASGVSSLTVTLINPTTPGNLLIMVGANWCWALNPPTGGGVTAWSKAAASQTNTNIEIWYGVVGKSSSTGVTIATGNGCTGGMWMNLTEWSGLSGAQSQVLDKGAARDGTTSPASASTTGITTTNANDLLIFGVSQSSTGTFGAPTLGGTPGPWSAMTAITTPAKQSAWYQVVSVTGTYNPDVGVSTAWDAAIAAFKVATVSAPVDNSAGKLYVGASDGKVHQLAVTTGVDEAQATVPPSAQFDKGFNFRATAAFVADGGTETYVLGDAYPTTRNGVTFGWETSTETTADRVSTNDRRLAGVNQQTNNGTQATFRVDLPATGSYQIHLALGDATFAQGDQYLQLKDNTTVLVTLDKPAGTAIQQFYDATGALWSNTNWPPLEAATPQTFGSTILRVVIGTPTAGANSSTLAHLRIVQEGTPTAGDPSFDYVLNRIYVGASDGHIYSFAVPF